MHKFSKYLKKPNLIGLALLKRFCWRMPDRIFLLLRFRLETGFSLHLKHPKRFNEKLQWLKLYDRKDVYTTMVDKFAVKQYVSDIIGGEYIIPTLDVWNSPEDINFDKLPNQFVLKTTHGGGSGGVFVCRDKSKLDKENVKKTLSKSLEQDIFRTYKEWPYKNIQKRIIAEKLLVDSSSPSDLWDYKFFCFNGVVKFLKVDFNRFIGHRANYYDLDWNLLEFGEAAFLPDPNKVIPKPKKLQEMKNLAERLSHNIPFLRVDFYYLNDNIYFGELTFFPASGFGKFYPDEWDYKLGELLKLPIK